MSKTHEEIKETQVFLNSINQRGIQALDKNDLAMIDDYINKLEPYLKVVDYTINNLKNILKHTYNIEREKQLNFYNHKSFHLHRLIPQLKQTSSKLKETLEVSNGEII